MQAVANAIAPIATSNSTHLANDRPTRATMSHRKRSSEDASINLTPMIDVVFLLVIFFLVGSKYSEQESQIDVTVPAVGQVQPIANGPDQRVVSVTATGQLLLDGVAVTQQDLSQQLQQSSAQYPDLKVVVRADSTGSLQGFAEAVHLVRRSGVEKIGIAVKVDPSPGMMH